jgi:hypothetical protein
MSFIFNNKIEYSDSQNLDAFGRLRTSNVTSLLEYKHIHDKLPLVINEVTGGTVTSTFDSPNSQVVMTVAANNSYVIRQGKSRGIYQPGKGQLVEFSFGNFQLESNVIKRVVITIHLRLRHMIILLMVTFWSLMELQIPYHFNCGTTVQVF